MKKIFIIGFLICSFFICQTVKAEIKTENLYEACETEGLTCDVEDKEFDESLPNIYIFRGNGCGYCQRLLTYLGSIAKDYKDKVNFVVYEVGNNTDNWDLYEKVGAKFGDEISGYPYMVIGKYIFNGYASSDNEDIKSAIDSFIASENPYDVVEEVNKGNLDEVDQEKVGNVESNTTGAVLAFIFGVVVVLVLLMSYSLSKKNAKK